MTISTTHDAPHTHEAEIIYPESDGEPMAENTWQFRYIVMIKEGVDALFHHDPLVFVAGDLFWYPVQGDNKTRQAPDTMVVFGRPKGDRRSYRQWEEAHIAPQVVFEVLSLSNRPAEMRKKHGFYEEHGVEEYYLYDPENGTLEGWLREDDRLVRISEMQGWVSPRLEVRFELNGSGLVLYRPDGRRFETYLELEQRAQRLAERLRQLGIDPDEV